MTCTSNYGCQLDLDKRDDRRQMAKWLDLSPGFGEQLTKVHYDLDGEAMVLRASLNDKPTGTLAVCSNPAGRTAPVFEGSPGLWSGPGGLAECGPVVAAFDISSIAGAYSACAASSMVCMDPAELESDDALALAGKFMVAGIGEEFLRNHPYASAFLIVSAPGSRVSNAAFRALHWAISRSGFIGPVLRAPQWSISTLVNPAHPRQRRLEEVVNFIAERVHVDMMSKLRRNLTAVEPRQAAA
jgi:hypothetical protein